jgi:hypothetical protein
VNRSLRKAAYAGTLVLVFVAGLAFTVAWCLREYDTVTRWLFVLCLSVQVFGSWVLFVYTRSLLDETLSKSSGQGERVSMGAIERELLEKSGLDKLDCEYLTWCRGDHSQDYSDSWSTAYYLPRSDVTVFIVRKPGQS